MNKCIHEFRTIFKKKEENIHTHNWIWQSVATFIFLFFFFFVCLFQLKIFTLEMLFCIIIITAIFVDVIVEHFIVYEILWNISKQNIYESTFHTKIYSKDNLVFVFFICILYSITLCERSYREFYIWPMYTNHHIDYILLSINLLGWLVCFSSTTSCIPFLN